jgi:starvation-inducible DNA-binding protein
LVRASDPFEGEAPLFTSNNDQTCTTLIELINARLADTIDLLYQAKQAHWNITGSDFYALHEFFEKISDEVRVHVDDIAERVTQLGGQAEGTLKTAAERSSLPEYPKQLSTGSAHLEALSSSLAVAATSMRHAIEQADNLGDEVTVDILVAASRAIEKLLWMVRAHGQPVEPRWADQAAADRKPESNVRPRH